mgnify:CR=1 FL=1
MWWSGGGGNGVKWGCEWPVVWRGDVVWVCGVGYESVCEGVCECPWKCMGGGGRGGAYGRGRVWSG